MLLPEPEAPTTASVSPRITCTLKPTEEYGRFFQSLGAKIAQLDGPAAQKLGALTTEIAECTTRLVGVPTPPRPAPSNDPNAEVDALATRACACRDPSCGRKSLTELVALARKYKNSDKGDEARAKTSAERMVTCLIKIGVSQQDLQTAFAQLQNL